MAFPSHGSPATGRSPLSDITNRLNNGDPGSPRGFSDDDGIGEPSGQFTAVHDLFSEDPLVIQVNSPIHPTCRAALLACLDTAY